MPNDVINALANVATLANIYDPAKADQIAAFRDQMQEQRYRNRLNAINLRNVEQEQQWTNALKSSMLGAPQQGQQPQQLAQGQPQPVGMLNNATLTQALSPGGALYQRDPVRATTMLQGMQAQQVAMQEQQQKMMLEKAKGYGDFIEKVGLENIKDMQKQGMLAVLSPELQNFDFTKINEGSNGEKIYKPAPGYNVIYYRGANGKSQTVMKTDAEMQAATEPKSKTPEQLRSTFTDPKAPIEKRNEAFQNFIAGNNTIESLTALSKSPNLTPEMRKQVLDIKNTLQSDKEKAAKAAAARVTVRQQQSRDAAAHQYDSRVQKIGDAIISGKQPPTISGFGMSKLAGPLREYFADKGFDLTAAEADWTAVKKHMATMNSSQQLRLVQAVGFTKESLNQIRDLATQWDGGNFPVLNKANLVAAANGAYGKKAASIATRLQSQIADLTSELGTVYKGGNGSTDESLKLAAENLKAEWDKDVLFDNISQVEKNLALRENSMRTSGISGLSIGSLYAPKKGKTNSAPPMWKKPGTNSIPMDAVEHLRQNPTAEMRKYFDEKYGKGHAAIALKGD